MKALWSCCQAFSAEECNWIVETVKKEPPVWASTGDKLQGMKKVFEHRRSKVFWIEAKHPKLGYLHRKYWDVVNMMNNAYYGAHITDLPPLQFTQYSEDYQGEYKIHMDLDWLDRRDLSHRPNQQRKISAIVQLSDPKTYEGGEFEFGPEVRERPDCNLIRQQGILMSFPSFVHHGVKPVTKGIRYSLVGWFEGPPWR